MGYSPWGHKELDTTEGLSTYGRHVKHMQHDTQRQTKQLRLMCHLREGKGVMGLRLHRKVKVKSLSRVRLFATPWTIAYQAPPSMGFSRQECWSGLPFPSPGDLPDPGNEPRSPALQADALPSEPSGKPDSTGEKDNL